MIPFVYCDDNGAISIKLDDERLIEKLERDIVGEIKLAATDEKFERAKDLITGLLDYRDARKERKEVQPHDTL